MENTWEASSIIIKKHCLYIEKTPLDGSFHRIATWNTPYVSYAYKNVMSGKSIALLFYKDGLNLESLLEMLLKAGNAFDCTVACFDATNLNAANSFLDVIKAKRLSSLPMAIVVYDIYGNIHVVKKLTFASTTALKRTANEDKSYWCWWRDGSHYEVATLLRLSDKYEEELGDIYTNKVYPEFYNMMVEGRTKQWNGSPRKKTFSKACYKSEKQNYKIPMFHLGLWDEDEGRLTIKGHALLRVVEKYGEDSHMFFDCLAKLVLLDGRHLDLIKDLESFQHNNREIMPETSAEYFKLFDEYLMDNGSIGTRKPTAIKTGAKNAYFRDEVKLWNKFGFILSESSAKYYRPFQGIEIDWNRINNVLLNTALTEAMKDGV